VDSSRLLVLIWRHQRVIQAFRSARFGADSVECKFTYLQLTVLDDSFSSESVPQTP